MDRVGKVHLALWLVAGVGAIGVAGCGKGATAGCTDLAACGGSPVGVWTNIVDECEFQPVRPSQAVDVTQFTQNSTGPMASMITPPQPNPVVLQQTTSGDWCSSLVYNPDGTVSNVVLWHDAPTLRTANINYAADTSYLTSLTFSTAGFPTDRNTTHFPPRCLLANGAVAPPNGANGLPAWNCSAFATALTAFYMPQGTAPKSFDNIACANDPDDGGCTCTYDYSVVVSDQGNWKTVGTTLLQDSSIFLYNNAQVDSQAPGATLETSYCLQGGHLQLSGTRGGSLFGVLGLRTLELSQSQP
jgi:hypothetical protein